MEFFKKHLVVFVSPAYGYIGSALVKCSNNGGPGPRHKMKGDPGYSIFSMPVVYGYYLHPLTSSENQVAIRISGNPLPPARFFIALLWVISGKPGRAGTTKTHPWRAGTGHESI